MASSTEREQDPGARLIFKIAVTLTSVCVSLAGLAFAAHTQWILPNSIAAAEKRMRPIIREEVEQATAKVLLEAERTARAHLDAHTQKPHPDALSRADLRDINARIDSRATREALELLEKRLESLELLEKRLEEREANLERRVDRLERAGD